MMKSERELAVELVKMLDGVPLKVARLVLSSAAQLLMTTQVVCADSPLLRSAATEQSQADRTFA